MRVPIFGWTIDERFLSHRQRSTSIGGIAGALVAAGLFFYHLIVHDTIEWGLFAVLATVAIVKVAVMVWSFVTE